MIGRKLELGIHSQIFRRLDRHLGEKIGGLLVDAAKPGLVYGVLDAVDLLDARFVGLGQQLDDRDLMTDDQPVQAGHVDTLAEALADRTQVTEQQERHQDGQQGQQRTHFFAHQVAPDQVEVLHTSGSVESWPLFR